MQRQNQQRPGHMLSTLGTSAFSLLAFTSDGLSKRTPVRFLRSIHAEVKILVPIFTMGV